MLLDYDTVEASRLSDLWDQTKSDKVRPREPGVMGHPDNNNNNNKLRRLQDEFRDHLTKKQYGVEDSDDYSNEISYLVSKGMAEASDYQPQNPYHFYRDLSSILRDIQSSQGSYRSNRLVDRDRSGKMRRFNETATRFLTEIQPDVMARRPITVPKEFQVDLLEQAKSFSSNPKLIMRLVRLFKDEYSTMRVAAASRLRELAAYLLKLI